MRKTLLAAVGLVLAGCASGVPVSRQVVVPGGQFQAVQGEAGLLVRTFVEDPAGERREVVGAACDIVSSLYRASVVTPSRLVVPNFGAQSPLLTADCRADGLSGSGSVRIVTRWQQPPGGYWGYPGFWGPWGWDGPWGGWSGPGYPVSDYPNLFVLLR
jgi:hypothetical protein